MMNRLLYFCGVALVVSICYLFGININAKAVTHESINHIYAYDTSKVIGKGSISPKDLGLDSAKNDIDRYWIIYNTHVEASKRKIPIDYSGIDSLEIELPLDAKSIKVDGSIDFKGLKLYIKNDSKNMFLFILNNKEQSIVIPQEIIDGDDFRSILELRNGTHQLILSDENKWVEYREGHDYGHIRKDIRLIVNGMAQNKSVMPYGNKNDTKIICHYAKVDTISKVLSNLTFIRCHDSKKKTYFLRATNTDNIELREMFFYTPEVEDHYSDHIFLINNCTNVVFRDVVIQGTYSQKRKYGYGISMDNVWNVKCYNLKGDAKWGIWGNNNINTTYLKDCDLNRYDIHCYGRDITMEDCYFHDGNLQIASVYGKVIYKRCTLYNFQPVCIRADYNSYVPFDLRLVDCVWYPTGKQNAIADMGRLDSKKNKRSELKRKSWPNIYIRNLDIRQTPATKKLFLYKVHGAVKLGDRIDYLSSIDISGITRNDNNVTMDICNEPVRIKRNAQIDINDTTILIDTKNLKNN